MAFQPKSYYSCDHWQTPDYLAFLIDDDNLTLPSEGDVVEIDGRQYIAYKIRRTEELMNNSQPVRHIEIYVKK